MTQVIQYLKLLIVSLFMKGKELLIKIWSRIWNKNMKQEVLGAQKEKEKKEKLTSSKKYNFLFQNGRTIENLKVSERHWNKITQSLPKKFTIPNPDTMTLFDDMKANTYDVLFKKPAPTPHLYVDRDVWVQIKSNLPKRYLMPTQVFEDTIGPMRSEYYDHLFAAVAETKKVTVDNRVWERINKNLPVNYKLPIPLSTSNVRPSLEHSPILMKHHFN